MASPMKFDDKEKAYAYAKAQNDLVLANWCPLSREKCRTDCQCWAHAYVRDEHGHIAAGPTKRETSTWWVYAAQCENRMFDGGRSEL